MFFPQGLAEPWFEWKQDQYVDVEKIIHGEFLQMMGVVSFFISISCTDIWGRRHGDDISQLAEVLCHCGAWGAIPSTAHSEKSAPWGPPEGHAAVLGEQWGTAASENTPLCPPDPWTRQGFSQRPTLQPRCQHVATYTLYILCLGRNNPLHK